MPSIWKETSIIIGQDLAGVISMARNQPYFSAGSQLYSIYGILAFIFWPNYLLWHERFNYLNSLKATFINPNVAAVYFGAAILTWLLIFAKTIKIDSTGDRRPYCFGTGHSLHGITRGGLARHFHRYRQGHAGEKTGRDSADCSVLG